MAKKNDLVVRLLLDNATFEGNIRQSSKEVRKFREQVEKGTDILDNLTGGLVKGAMKYASWGAAAASAGKLVADAYMSSEQAADEWRRIQTQCTEAYSYFVKSIESGSWTNFFGNLSKAIEDAAELYDKLDRLGSIKTNNSAAIAIVRNAIAEANRQLADKSITDEQRKALQASIKQNEARLRGMMSEQSTAGKQAGFAQIKQSLSGYGLTDKQMREATYQLINKGQKYYDEMDAVIKEWVASNSKGTQNFSGNWGAFTKSLDDDAMPGYVKLAYAVKQGESDPNRLAGMQTYVDAINYAAQAEREARTALRQANRGVGGTSGGTTTKRGSAKSVEDEIEVGSLTYINNLISKLTRQRDATIDTSKQSAIDEQIAELVRQRINLMYSSKGATPPQLEAIGGSVGDVTIGTPTIDSDGVSEAMRGIAAYNEAIAKMREEAADGAMETAINGLGNAFRNLGSCIGDTAGQVMMFAAQTAQAIAQLIAQNAALMASAQAASLAGAAKNAFQLPFPYNLAMYASLAATIFGIFASLPKFAEGGIVGGITTGDRNLVRVNGGEMILTTAQQQRLFNILNGKGGAASGGNVRFVIDGDALVGVVDNYSRKRGVLL